MRRYHWFEDVDKFSSAGEDALKLRKIEAL
jgi:hypothetical protein